MKRLTEIVKRLAVLCVIAGCAGEPTEPYGKGERARTPTGHTLACIEDPNDPACTEKDE